MSDETTPLPDDPELGIGNADSMRLQILLPAEILVEEEVLSIVAEAQNGAFGMLPRHIDFVAALVPGILSYVNLDEQERFVGTDHGTLVKHGREVLVSTRSAVPGDDLGRLREMVEEKFLELDDHERSARSALARLEAGVVRHFIKLEE